MPRNNAMKEALSAAGLKVVAPEVEQRAARIKTRFNKRFPHVPIVEPEPPKQELPALQLVSAPAPPAPIDDPAPPIPPPPISVLPQAPTPPVAALPPELSWLTQPGPCGESLNSIVNKCRDARAYLGFELENAIKRELEKRAAFDRAKLELETAQAATQGVRSQLDAIKDTFDACSLIADQTKKIAALSRVTQSSFPRHHRNSPCVCKRADVIPILESDKERAWSASELADRLPEEKRASGRINIPALLSTMLSEGRVARQERGRYRFIS